MQSHSIKNILYFFTITIICLGACQDNNKTPGVKGIEHVVVVGVDGMSPDGIMHAKTPHMDAMMANGAYTLKARAVMPTSSSPNWASILMGAGPEVHGITDNSFNPDEPALPPLVSGNGKRKLFPTIFEIIRRADPEAKQAAIYHWNDISKLFEHEHLDFHTSPETEDEVINMAIDHLKKEKPRYTFLHLDHVDHAGHSHGHGSDEYYQSVEKADSLIGVLINALENMNMHNNTLIIITADHGGIAYGHGGSSPEEIAIPFLIQGPGVKKGFEILETVNTTDNSATVAFALGIEPPEAWTGKPVKSAFEGFDVELKIYPTQTFLTKPKIYPEGLHFKHPGGLYLTEKPSVKMSTQNEQDQIRYTLDGTVPTAKSPIYENPFELTQTTVVKAAVFQGNQKVTQSNTAYFRVVDNPEGRGVQGRFYYSDGMEALPDFNHLKPVGESFYAYEFTTENLEYPQESEQVAILFDSYFKAEKEGKYTFYTASDDGSKLYINGQVVVDNDGNHGVIEKAGSITLKPGLHQIQVAWYNSGGGLWLNAYVEGPGIPKQIISADRLFLQK